MFLIWAALYTVLRKLKTDTELGGWVLFYKEMQKRHGENVGRLQHKRQELRRFQHQLEECLCRSKSAEKH